jgi:hypothetical protein
MIASFVKRLARLSLSAPPAAIIMIIPFVYNLLKRHSSCMCMLQRDSEDAESQDTYDEYEKDPMNTHALESSLWELKALQRHYLSHVATMSKVFQEVFTKPEFQMEDFLDHGYATVSSMRKATCDTHVDITRYSYSKRKSSEDLRTRPLWPQKWRMYSLRSQLWAVPRVTRRMKMRMSGSRQETLSRSCGLLVLQYSSGIT